MRAIGFTPNIVIAAINVVSSLLYDGNIEPYEVRDESNTKRDITRFRLRTVDSQGPGAKGSASILQSGTGPHGLRRTMSACWHVHYSVVEQVFVFAERFGVDLVVETKMAKYSGSVEDVREQMNATRWDNVGSQMFPITSTELCEC